MSVWHMHTRTHASTRTYMHIHIHISKSRHVQKKRITKADLLLAHVIIFVRAWFCVCDHICMCVICTCGIYVSYTHTHTHTHTYTHTYTTCFLRVWGWRGNTFWSKCWGSWGHCKFCECIVYVLCVCVWERVELHIAYMVRVLRDCVTHVCVRVLCVLCDCKGYVCVVCVCCVIVLPMCVCVCCVCVCCLF